MGPHRIGDPPSETVAGRTSSTNGLNENYKRRLALAFQQIDALLSKAEHILQLPGASSPFQRYVPDVPSFQCQVVGSHIREMRETKCRILEERDIPLNPRCVSAARALESIVISLDIAVTELEPIHMKGYGKPSEEAAKDLEGIVSVLRGRIEHLRRILGARRENDL